MVVVRMPNAQVMVEEATHNGQRAQKVKLVGHRPTAAQRTLGLTHPLYFAVFGGST
jgi:hypothetical protein